MNYKVLYRKYRPDTFESVIGQEFITTTLMNSIVNNKISHAYLFSGPRGTGKTSTAKIFAKAINCLNPENGNPCGKCQMCEIYKESPDIIEIDAASNNGVDEIRNLIDNIKIMPTSGKYKIYIIDEVHMLTSNAFNALLLTLEEPPAHVVFILATTNVENVPITILSRCQRFDFQKISVDNITKSVLNICKKENISIDEDAANEIALISEGGMRDALSILDQLSKSSSKITLDMIENELKTVSEKLIEELIDAINNNDANKCSLIIEDLRLKSADYNNFAKKFIKFVGKTARKIKNDRYSTRLQYEEYKNIVFEVTETIVKNNINVDSFLLFEMIILKYCNTENIVNKPEVIKNDLNKVNNENNELSKNIAKTRINNCLYGAKKEYLETVKNIVTNIKNQPSTDGIIKSILDDAEPVVASDSYIIFSVPSDHIAKVNNDKLKEIENRLAKCLKKDYKIVFISNKKWVKEKEQYINNLKNGIKYIYINEEDNDNSISNVFNTDKLEII